MAIDLRVLAREGARARIAQLMNELAEIRRAFPDVDSGAAPASGTTQRRGRRGMTAAERKAVGIRMKAYWAARRKAASKD
jgi:hypothetical protein